MIDLKIKEFNKNNVSEGMEEILDNITDKINDIYDEVIKSVLPSKIANKVIKIKDAMQLDQLSKKVEEITKKVINKEDSKSKYKVSDEINIKDNIEKIVSKINDIANLEQSECTEINNKKDTITEEIEDKLKKQINNYAKAINKNDEYIAEWKDFYNAKDFKSMDKVYKKIEKNVKDILPIEEKIKEFRKVENLHLIIKRKGGDFNLTNEELELAKRLI